MPQELFPHQLHKHIKPVDNIQVQPGEKGNLRKEIHPKIQNTYNFQIFWWTPGKVFQQSVKLAPEVHVLNAAGNLNW